MTLLLRRQNAQDRHEGREPLGWKDHDYAVLDDERRIGRIYKERQPAGFRWMWFIQSWGPRRTAVPPTRWMRPRRRWPRHTRDAAPSDRLCLRPAAGP